MTAHWKERSRSLFLPLAAGLAKRGVKPDHLTIAGLAFSLLAALLLGRGDFIAAAIFIGLGGLCDMLDGDVARVRGRVTRFGAFLDSTLDRAGEGALYAGLAYFYLTRPPGGVFWFRSGDADASLRYSGGDAETLALLALGILLLSFLVSYTRARAEGLGLECKVGIMERPERLLTLATGAVLGPRFMPGILGILFLLTLVTVVQRVYHVRRSTQEGPAASGPPPQDEPGRGGTAAPGATP